MQRRDFLKLSASLPLLRPRFIKQSRFEEQWGPFAERLHLAVLEAFEVGATWPAVLPGRERIAEGLVCALDDEDLWQGIPVVASLIRTEVQYLKRPEIVYVTTIVHSERGDDRIFFGSIIGPRLVQELPADIFTGYVRLDAVRSL